VRPAACAAGAPAWLEGRPQLGPAVFVRSQPESLGTAVEPAPLAFVIEFLWAPMALFDDAPQDAAIATVYHPPWQALYSSVEARQRVLALLAALPHGAWLDQLLPVDRIAGDLPAHIGLRRRSAWASSFLAGLELARQGVAVLTRDGPFAPIHLRQADAQRRAVSRSLPATFSGVPYHRTLASFFDTFRVWRTAMPLNCPRRVRRVP
jgi:segregation and condensation protein A